VNTANRIAYFSHGHPGWKSTHRRKTKPANTHLTASAMMFSNALYHGLSHSKQTEH